MNYLLINVAFASLLKAADLTFTKQTLDDMANFYEKGAVYDPDYFNHNLTSCFDKFNDDLSAKVQENMWSQQAEYWLSNGTAHDWMNHTDRWGQCAVNSTFDNRCDTSGYMRHTPGLFGKDNMIVYEPCNYVSNVAYYHSATRICDYPLWTLNEEYIKEFKRGFLILTMGSAMWHGSHTYLGYQFDNTMIAVIAYTGYQGMISTLDTNNPILRDLSDTPRNQTGIEVSAALSQWLANEPAEKWGEFLANLDIEIDYFYIFGAIVTAVFTLVFPWFITKFLITNIAALTLPPDIAAFITDSYMPAFKVAVKDVSLSYADRQDIFYKFVGMIIKIIYAFCYQEIFVHIGFLYQDIPMKVNSFLMPYINGLASKISGFPQTDEDMNSSKNMYPGDDHCRSYSPHAVWHEEAANGFLEIIMLADAINGVLSKAFDEIQLAQK